MKGTTMEGWRQKRCHGDMITVMDELSVCLNATNGRRGAGSRLWREGS